MEILKRQMIAVKKLLNENIKEKEKASQEIAQQNKIMTSLVN